MTTITRGFDQAHTGQYRRAATQPPGTSAWAERTIVFLLFALASVVGVICLLAGLYA
jgi:hypothetical protein